jgi:aryl-alcohol dehydrogenase-like predicted oxidoreductase
MSLIIGSAQFGLDYGISNKRGLVEANEVKKIINLAEANDIQEIDTAVNYGSSQDVIGSVKSKIKVSSKLPAIDLKTNKIEKKLIEIIIETLKSLDRSNLKTLYLHDPSQLFETGGSEIYEHLQTFKLDGLIERIGVSVYNPEDLERLIKHFDFDTVQVPYNVIDRRFDSDTLLSRLKQKNIEINCRSIFLQGLLLIPFLDIPKQFMKWKDIFLRWGNWLDENSIHPVHACIAGAKQNDFIDNIVIGVESANQLEQVINFYKMCENRTMEFPQITSFDTYLVNPSHWGN